MNSTNLFHPFLYPSFVSSGMHALLLQLLVSSLQWIEPVCCSTYRSMVQNVLLVESGMHTEGIKRGCVVQNICDRVLDSGTQLD